MTTDTRCGPAVRLPEPGRVRVHPGASQPPHDPRDQIADMDPAIGILADLARAKVTFQLRAVCAVLDTNGGAAIRPATPPAFDGHTLSHAPSMERNQ